jgi:hypothetical protein
MTPLAAAQAATAAAASEIQGDLVDGREAFSVNDSLLEDTLRRITSSGVIERVEEWIAEDAKGPGGRPATFPVSALLVVMFSCARMGRAMLVTEWLRIVRNMSPAARASLGLPDPPGVDEKKASLAYYRNLRTRFHKVEALMDFSPYVRNRRLPAEEMARLMVARLAELTPERVEQLKARQEWFINRILRISLRAVPKDLLRLWGRGGLAVDATPVATFARGPRRKGKPKRGRTRPIVIYSACPDSGWYIREGDHGDVDFLPDGSQPDKTIYGLELTLAILCATGKDERGLFPKLITGMPLPHVPGNKPGINGRRAVELSRENLASLGITVPKIQLAGDNAYVNALPRDFAVPLRTSGVDLVLDYNKDQLGIQGSHHGALLVEGWWYCPAMPQQLIDATIDHRAGTIDDATYERRIDARRAFEFRLKELQRPDGSIRLMCPAAGTATTVRCRHKPHSEARKHLGKRRVDLNHLLEDHPPKVCRQQTIVIPAIERGRFEQPLRLGSPEWTEAYKTYRSTNEGGYGILKDADKSLADPKFRRLRGQAATALLTCFIIAAANLTAIASWALNAKPDANGITRLHYAERTAERTPPPEPEPAATSPPALTA